MTQNKRHKKGIEIRSHYEKAIWSPLDSDDINELSIEERCALINKMLKHNPQHHKAANSNTIHTSLQRLGSSFSVSDFFINWQNQRRSSFLRELKKPRNRDILSGYSNWNNIDIDTQKEVLKKSARLHIKIYTDGLYGAPSYKHIFEQGATRIYKGMVNIVYGGFRSNITTNEAIIVNYTQHDKLPYRAIDVFDTTHHETTHLIQDYFAKAVYNGNLSEKDGFHQEASYFLALAIHKANIPSHYGNSYRDQPHEKLADMEGGRISAGIEALSL